MARPAVQLPMQGTFQCDTVNCGREHLRWGVGKLAATAEVTPTILPMYHRGMNEVVPSNADRATTAVNFPTAGKKVALRIGDPIDITDLLDEYRGGEEDLLSGIGYYGFFRTVQAFPGLVKRWFDQDAERNSKAIAVNFLEKQAGRLILKKELDIINKSKSSDLVGDMNITGSLVSREVVATYLQDESLLEVTIKLPKCFPLRNAEVDCSKR